VTVFAGKSSTTERPCRKISTMCGPIAARSGITCEVVDRPHLGREQIRHPVILNDEQGRRARRKASCQRGLAGTNLSAEKIQGCYASRFHGPRISHMAPRTTAPPGSRPTRRRTIKPLRRGACMPHSCQDQTICYWPCCPCLLARIAFASSKRRTVRSGSNGPSSRVSGSHSLLCVGSKKSPPYT